MVVCFFWTICNKESLRAREMWLMGLYIYVAVYLLTQLISIVLIYTSDWAEQVCIRSERYENHEECVQSEQ